MLGTFLESGSFHDRLHIAPKVLSNGLPVSNLPVKRGGVKCHISDPELNNIYLELDNTCGYMYFYFRFIVVYAQKTRDTHFFNV